MIKRNLKKKRLSTHFLTTLFSGTLTIILLMGGCKNIDPGIYTAEKYYLDHNYTRAYEKLLPLADDGDPDAQYALGYIYFYGLGVAKNENLARHWIEKSAKQNNPYAKESLKMIFEDTNYHPSGKNQPRIRL